MAYIIADNIISPLGDTSAANYEAVRAGRTCLAHYPAGSRGVPETFTASLFSPEADTVLRADGLSRFESMAYRSASRAVAEAGLDVSSDRVVFILSTTKGNVEALCAAPERDTDAAAVLPGESARRIAVRLGIPTVPVVVCNACISGLSALILADRLLRLGLYDYAVVCGADSQSRFIISGFQSLKALSEEECRPFDIERTGLNLGEAAATLVLSRTRQNGGRWKMACGAVRNDAYHISTPARDGDGLYRALRQVMSGRDAADLAFVSAHGTATLFNDQMESVALTRAGLTDTPVDALKGYFGHTMGAAGILETILSMCAVDDGLVLGTRHYDESGVSGHIRVCASNQPTDRHCFLKMLSGFGGCNAVAWMSRTETLPPAVASAPAVACPSPWRTVHRVEIRPDRVTVDGRRVAVNNRGEAVLAEIYKEHVGGYAKFYKMDGLCRLGFIASELLLQAEDAPRFVEREDRAIAFANHSSSIDADRRYVETIRDGEAYYPSPAAFVYTLPNIVTGEIAMRNRYHGETSFFILPERDDTLMEHLFSTLACDPQCQSFLGGWLDYEDDTHFTADLRLMERTNTASADIARQ